MTEEQKRKIRDMRIGGHSYTEIADVLGLPRDTIKKHCQRHPVASTTFHCLYCNVAIPTVHGRRQPKFCSKNIDLYWVLFLRKSLDLRGF